MISNKWTEKEISLLKKEYEKPIPDLISLSKKIGRLRSNICRKARQLDLGTSYSRKKSKESIIKHKETKGWPKVTEDRLKKLYNDFTNKELATILGKTESSIEHKAEGLSLKKDINERGWFFRNGHPKGMLGKHHSGKMKKVISEASKKSWGDPNHYLNSDEYKQLLSDRTVKLIKSGKLRSGYSRGKMGTRKDLGIYVRSSWEANFARYLNWMKERGEIKDWKYEADTFDFPIKRGVRSYMPDFKVWENDDKIIYYEIKGWMTQRGATAIKRFRKYYPDKKLILIEKKEYNDLSKWKRLFPNWE